jgi:hypothetical protein
MKPVSSRATAVATLGFAFPRATSFRKRDVRRSWAFHAISQIGLPRAGPDSFEMSLGANAYRQRSTLTSRITDGYVPRANQRRRFSNEKQPLIIRLFF